MRSKLHNILESKAYISKHINHLQTHDIANFAEPMFSGHKFLL